MAYPNVFTLKNLFEHCNSVSVQTPDGWVPARPLGYASITSRIKAAWFVFTGKADAVIWPNNQ